MKKLNSRKQTKLEELIKSPIFGKESDESLADDSISDMSETK
jgi:hypothetical protein